MSDVKGMSHVMASAVKALSLSIDKNVQFFMEVASMFHVGPVPWGVWGCDTPPPAIDPGHSVGKV